MKTPQNALTELQIDTIIEQLWAPLATGEQPCVYALLDGARHKRIEPIFNNSHLNYACLYAGRLSYAMQRAAPHLALLDSNSADSRTLLAYALLDGFGIIVVTPPSVTLSNLRSHFRRITKVALPNKRRVNFRFYDPRVLPNILTVSSQYERALILGPASCIVMAVDHGQTQLLARQSLNEITLDKPTNNIRLPSHRLSQVPVYGNGLCLRQEHIDIFTQKNTDTFFEETYLSYVTIFEPNTDRTFDINNEQLTLKPFLKYCFPSAYAFNLKDGYSVVYFLNLCTTLGFEFWLNPALQWIHEILKQERPAEARIEQIERRMAAQHLKEAWN